MTTTSFSNSFMSLEPSAIIGNTTSLYIWSTREAMDYSRPARDHDFLNGGTIGEVSLYGYPGPVFYIIHITGIVSLTVSASVSFGVLVHLLCFEKKRFPQRPIAERLVVYLALSDLFWSISHELDHCYMLIITDHPPDLPCSIFGFLLVQFIMAQALIVLFTSLNAFMLVVKGKNIPLGRYDWRLFLVTFIFPLVISTTLASIHYIGRSGAW